MATYQKAIPLKPGTYKLTLMVQDKNSGKMSVSARPIRVGPFEEKGLATSTMVLADKILSSDPGVDLTDPFVVPSGFKVFPNLTRRFTNRDRCILYMEAYEVAVDQASSQPFRWRSWCWPVRAEWSCEMLPRSSPWETGRRCFARSIWGIFPQDLVVSSSTWTIGSAANGSSAARS